MALPRSNPVSLPSGSWPVRIVAVLVALGVLLLLVQSRVGFVLARVQPEMAVQVAPNNADALRALLDFRLLRAKQEDVPALTALSIRALRAEPFNPVALRTLGLFAAYAGDERRADRLITTAGRLSLRDLFTHAWLFETRYKQGRYREAFAEADIMLRQRSANWDVVLPTLTARLANPQAIDPLARMLATRPTWRGSLLLKLGDKSVDVDDGYTLLARLKAHGAPATTAEATPYFTRAMAETPLPLLYRRWTSLLDPATRAKAGGLLRDGAFAGLDAPPPFAWRLFNDGSGIAEVTQSPIAGQGRALYISFAGDRQVTLAEQQLLLAPGRYRFAGRAATDTDLAPNRAYWSLRCGRGAQEQEIAQQPLAPTRARADRFALDFTVPAGCAGPKLSLIGARSDAMESADLWIDDLSLVARR